MLARFAPSIHLSLGSFWEKQPGKSIKDLSLVVPSVKESEEFQNYFLFGPTRPFLKLSIL